ncbi:MAG: cytochrome b/b6 domain-containing protein [Candidatus Eisenbacteria bacterium]
MPPLRILRFRKTERLVHWSLAIPFLVCFITAIILVFVYNPAPRRPYHEVFSWIHRISGLCLATFPIIALIRSRGDFRIHFYNIAQAWLWTLNDIKWLGLMGLASVSKRFSLPEQGKFNAAEKLNFMMLMTTYPLYVATGLTIWLTHNAFLAWIVHFGMAMLATPLVLGHIYMATLNRDTRKGLPGMISGFVDRQWAKHHYREWYREFHEEEESPEPQAAEPEAVTPAERSFHFDDADPRTAADPSRTVTEAGPPTTAKPAKPAHPSFPFDEADPRTAAGPVRAGSRKNDPIERDSESDLH